MANVTVYNMEGKEVGTIELNDAVFGVEINEHLVHMAVVNQLANNRQGTQKAKTRSCKTGFNKSSAVDRRRNGIRTGPERLFFQNEQKRKESSSEVRSDQPCTG